MRECKKNTNFYKILPWITDSQPRLEAVNMDDKTFQYLWIEVLCTLMYLLYKKYYKKEEVLNKIRIWRK